MDVFRVFFTFFPYRARIRKVPKNGLECVHVSTGRYQRSLAYSWRSQPVAVCRKVAMQLALESLPPNFIKRRLLNAFTTGEVLDAA